MRLSSNSRKTRVVVNDRCHLTHQVRIVTSVFRCGHPAFRVDVIRTFAEIASGERHCDDSSLLRKFEWISTESLAFDDWCDPWPSGNKMRRSAAVKASGVLSKVALIFMTSSFVDSANAMVANIASHNIGRSFIVIFNGTLIDQILRQNCD